MSSEEPSCSECKLELIEKKWTQLMLKWINRCVSPHNKMGHLALRNLVEIMDRYKGDVCADELELALLAGDEVESFIKYKYPMLRLRYLAEAKDYPKKLYIMAAILLYHCCANSQKGVIDRDICTKLYKVEQDLILRFCENLSEMETTINNVDLAIQKAFENVSKGDLPCESSILSSIEDIKENNEEEPTEPINEEEPETYPDTVEAIKSPNKKFKSSITVMPSVINQSAYSMSESSIHPSCFCDDEPGKVTDVKSEAATNADNRPSRNNLTERNMAQSNSETITPCQEQNFSKQNFMSDNKSNWKRDSGYAPSGTKYPMLQRQMEKLNQLWWNTSSSGAKLALCIFCSLMILLLVIASGIYYSKLISSVKHLKEEEEHHHHGSKHMEKTEDSEHTIAPGSPGGALGGSLGGPLGGPHGGPHEGSLGGPPQGSLESSTEGFPEDSHGGFSEGSIGESPGGFQGDSPGGFPGVSHGGSPGGSHGGPPRGLYGGSSAGGDLFGVYFPEVPHPPGGGLNVWPPTKGHLADSLSPAQHKINLNPEKTKIYRMLSQDVWQCEKGFCQKVYEPTSSNVYFTSLSRCSLLCMGPQLWPHPIGYTHYSSTLVALATQKLEYKFVSVPSDYVHQYLAEAFKLFIGDLARLERVDQKRHNQTDLTVKKMNIAIDVDNDADPRMRYDTDESYTVRVETLASQVHIHITSPSFCGIRHGLETLSQLILLDQSTGHLITLSNILVKDAPSYKYRGLMIDTARNYIPVADIMRTVDAMGTVKLNTFHWRISDATSFPWYLPEVPELFEYGAYDRTMVYTKQDILAIVHRAGIRGVRVLIEVAAPGPVGRAWSWSPHMSCHKEDKNFTTDELLCLKLKMKDSVLDILQTIYAQILELTKVDDIFHLSDGLFSLSNCQYFHKDNSEGFLEMALDRLRIANKGSLPRLPIVWYTSHLGKDFEAQVWDKFGVQMSEWVQGAGDPSFLSRFRVVHSSRWSLSCQMIKQRCTKYRTWQEMYVWKSWKSLEVLSLEGGEAMLWTDLVDSGNLDYHLWPRLSAVAERLWSDVAANETVNGYTYARLDALGWRMMIRGVTVQPVWPVYCSFNPHACINKIKYKYMLFSFKHIKNN